MISGGKSQRPGLDDALSSLEGRRSTEIAVRNLLRRCQETKVLSPRRFLENRLERLQQEHERAHPGIPGSPKS